MGEFCLELIVHLSALKISLWPYEDQTIIVVKGTAGFSLRIHINTIAHG